MKLTWYGHSCFKLDFGNGGSVIFDPYVKGSVQGVELPDNLSADAVLISHNHHDHDAADRVTVTGNKPAFEVEKIDTFHDSEKGVKRGKNVIHIVSYCDFKAAHFGDLGCPLTVKEIEKLKGLDLVLIPIGGFFTIDKTQAKQIIEEIEPRIAVPMHYRSGKMGFEVLGTLDDFLSLFPVEIIHQCDSSIDFSGSESGIYVPAIPVK